MRHINRILEQNSFFFSEFLVGIAQFLPTGIVRVGGRCQEEKLERFLLENVMKNHSRTKCFWGRRRELMSEMESEQIRLDGLIEELKMCKEALCTLSLLRRFVTGEQLNYFLRKNRDEMTVVGQWLMESYKEMNPCPVATFGDIPPMTDTSRSHRRLQREESELFDAQMEDLNRRLLDLDVDDLPKPKRKSPLVKSSNYQPVNEAVLKPLLVGDEMSMEEATKVRDVWKLSGANRWRLYRYWLSRHKRQLSKEFSDSQERYLSAADSLQELRNLEKLDILRSAKVVGMTTTGRPAKLKIVDWPKYVTFYRSGYTPRDFAAVEA